MEIPSKFKIGGQIFQIKLLDQVNNGNSYGDFSYCPAEIRLATKYEDNGLKEIPHNQMLNNFWHEVFHCFNYMWNTETDEALAQTFANFMCEYEESKEV